LPGFAAAKQFTCPLSDLFHKAIFEVLLLRNGGARGRLHASTTLAKHQTQGAVLSLVFSSDANAVAFSAG
jgi:hypothetical protein